MRIQYVLAALGLIGTMLAPLPAPADLSGPYFGGAYGMYRFDGNNIDEKDALWKAFLGAQLTDGFGVELGYVFLDRADDQGVSFEAEGFTAAGVVAFPLGRNSAFYLKGGAFWWDADTRGGVHVVNEDDTDPFWGAGFRFGLSDNFAWRVEYERYEVVETDIDTVSIGLLVNF